jgi:hypothetical protein
MLLKPLAFPSALFRERLTTLKWLMKKLAYAFNRQ